METFYLTTPKNKNIKTKWGDIKIFLSFFSLDVLYFLRQQAKMHSLQLGTFYVHILELCLYERQTIAHFHIKNSGTLTFSVKSTVICAKVGLYQRTINISFILTTFLIVKIKNFVKTQQKKMNVCLNFYQQVIYLLNSNSEKCYQVVDQTIHYEHF